MEQESSAFVWHREVIADTVAATLEALRDRGALDGFYLAGGTGLALTLGHRRSVDLDFFTQPSCSFDPEGLLARIETLPSFTLAGRDTETLHATVGGTKISFLGYRYPLLFAPPRFLAVPVADPRDIGCMKVNAIAARGSKRDFIDLFMVAREEGLPLLVQRFTAKYAQTHYNPLHIVKSLTFFDDAEKDPMPDMLVSCDWAAVKEFFVKAAPRLL